MRSQDRRRASGSKPVVGSSRKIDLGPADEREREVESAQLAARQRADARVVLLGEADELGQLAAVTGNE